MAFTYTQNFNSLSTADLNGQDSWSGNTNFDVGTTAPFEGAQSVQHTSSTEDQIERSITASTSGTVRMAMRKDSVAVGSPVVGFRIKEGATSLAQIYIGGNAGAASAFIAGASEVSLASGLSASTYYMFDLEYDCSTDQARARVAANEAALDAASWSSWISFFSSVTATNVDTIRILKDNGASDMCYWDDIRPSGSAAVAVVALIPQLLSMHVG